jgi:hypothetical protein
MQRTTIFPRSERASQRIDSASASPNKRLAAETERRVTIPPCQKGCLAITNQEKGKTRACWVFGEGYLSTHVPNANLAPTHGI